MLARSITGPPASLVGVILLVIASVAIYRSPYNASNLEIVPDSVEAAVGAQRFATLHKFDLSIDGREFPSRYSPWFSTIVLSPFYRFFPRELGIGILPVFALALMVVLMVFVISNHFAGPWAGAIANVALLRCPVFRAYCGEITTDIPTLAPLLIAGWIFVRSSEPLRRRDWLLAGIAIAAAAALRPTSLAATLPFFIRLLQTPTRKRLATSAGLFCAPIILLLAATALYQWHTFGDWRRTGYQFWCPVPYDFPTLTFSLRYITANLRSLGELWLPLGVGLIGSLALLFHEVKNFRPVRSLIVFITLTALPITVFHLIYFFSDARLFLPLALLCSIMGGIGFAHLLPAKIKNARALLPVLLLPLLAMYFDRPWNVAPSRREMTDRIIQQTPDNAVIITDLDPVYLEPTVVRGTHRQAIPVSRQVEYASKLIAPHGIAKVPPPTDPTAHRWKELKLLGCEEAVPSTADESADQIAAEAQKGIPVFFAFDFDGSPPAGLAAIYSAFARRHLPPPPIIR